MIHLLAVGEYNVIAVNWEKLARTPRYFYAVNNTRAVGYLTADLIEYIIEHYTNVTANNVHPVGMSLGAHVVGHLGYRLNGSLARITGLDPAGYKCHIKIHNFICFQQLLPNREVSNFLLLGPMFHTVPLSDRLSQDDAKFVDAIHCAGLWVGMDEKVYFASFNSRR